MMDDRIGVDEADELFNFTNEDVVDGVVQNIIFDGQACSG